MKKVINYYINWKIEAANLISNVIKERDYRVSFEIKDDQIRSDYEKLIRFSDKVTSKTKKILEEHKEITDIIKSFENNVELGDYFFVSFGILINDFLEKRLKKDQVKLIVFSKVFDFIKGVDEDSYKDERDFLDFGKYFDILQKNNISSESMGDLLNLHRNFDNIIESSRELIGKVAKVLEEDSKDIEEIIERKSNSIKEEDIKKILTSNLSAMSKDCRRTVSAINFRAMSYFEFDETKSAYLITGLLLIDIFNKENQNVSEEKRVARLKAIADPVRYQILELCLKRKTYLQEISKTLEIKPSTLSHHVQSMLNESVLRIAISDDSRKIYYEVNKDIMKEITKDLQRFI